MNEPVPLDDMESKLKALQMSAKKEEEEQQRFPTGAETQNAPRLVDTSASRGINEEMMRLTARQYLEKHGAEMSPEDREKWSKKAEDEEEGERLEEEALEEIKAAKGSPSSVGEIEQEMSAEQIILETKKRLNEVLLKDSQGEKLTTEEKRMLVLHAEVERAEKLLEDRLNSAEEIDSKRTALENELKEGIQREYSELKQIAPEQILRSNGLGPKQEGAVVGRNLIKGMAFILATHWSMRRGYVLLVKVWKSRGCEFIYLKQHPKFVEFWTKNERGEDVVNICKVRLINYRMMGSAVPVAFAVEGFIDAYDFFGNMRDEFTQELVQKMNLIYYWSGVLKGKETFPDQEDPSLWGKYKMIILIAIIVVIILVGMAYLQYQQVQDMKAQIDVLTSLLQASNQINSTTIKSLIDANVQLVSGGRL